jgi:CDP-6-deoxy-D-xylo-4-hexulose-3-dehydrase
MATFMTHCLGFDALKSVGGCRGYLIEDCCESIGATHEGEKLGTFGLASNFSFYYAHHMSTIEGGMVCTDDEKFYQCCRSLRAHGLLRESDNAEFRSHVESQYPDLDPNFIFLTPSFNMRSTEINAVLGRSQMKRLDAGIVKRTNNLKHFLSALDANKYRVAYRVEGSSNYALPLILQEADEGLMRRVLALMKALNVEIRRGTAGGGSQLRQPYLRALNIARPEDFPETEHVHFYGLYLGNFPELEADKIDSLCAALNAL